MSIVWDGDGLPMDWDLAAVEQFERLMKEHRAKGTPQLLARTAALETVEKSVAERKDPLRIAKAAAAIAKADRADNDRRAEADLGRIVERIRKEDGYRISREHAYARALETDQGRALYSRMRRHELREAGVPVDQDLDVSASADGVPVALAKAADAIQALDQTLTREQALEKACDENPDLVDEWRNA